jgi:hypothetical protein
MIMMAGLDAHAMWHAATAAITPMWYQFITEDTDADTATQGGAAGATAAPPSATAVATANGESVAAATATRLDALQAQVVAQVHLHVHLTLCGVSLCVPALFCPVPPPLLCKMSRQCVRVNFRL